MGTFRRVISLSLAAGLVVAPLTAAGASTSAGSDRGGFGSTGGGVGLIRVNQLGYSGAAGAAAYLMTSEAAVGARFEVVDKRGRRVLSGRVGQDAGVWNAKYQHVYRLDLSKVRWPGSYRVKVAGVPTSPAFVIGSEQRLLDGPKDKAVNFFTEQRDGANVVAGALGRKPAHLTDRAASVYEWPTFAGPDTDQTVGELQRIGGPVDVEGGWYDAGDYLKFTHIAAYSDSLLWASARDGRRPDTKLLKEARHGLDWLDKMWDERSKTLYIQVGVGTGNAEGTFVGDHDLWRLPEADDQLTSVAERHLRNRPVFRAAAPGQPISPNLAGRTAAAFALAAQVEARTDRRLARKHLETAAQIFAQAKTQDVGQLVTSLPFAFYPESAWRDDLELGAAELALAAQRLGDPRASGWVRQASYWAGQYLEHEAGGDTLNLYDVSALAHADLIRAARSDRALVAKLTGDLQAQLAIGTQRAAGDPFRAGAQYDNFDAVPHTFGLAATARLYRQVTGDRRYDTFGAQQLDWAFGANAWGVSFMVGVGANPGRCPHHQIGNIVGKQVVGAVVNGPNSASLFDDGLGDHLDGMNPCPANGVDEYAEYTGRGSRYVDDVRSWQASERADDFAAIAVYALTR